MKVFPRGKMRTWKRAFTFVPVPADDEGVVGDLDPPDEVRLGVGLPQRAEVEG